MAYTNAWNEALPGDNDPATAAADMRKIRLDVRERMETLLGPGNWITDPVSFATALQVMYIPHHAFQLYSNSGSSTLTVGTAGIAHSAVGGSVTYYAPLYIPRGVSVSQLSVIGTTTAGGSTITATLEELDATTGTVALNVRGTATMPTGTAQGVVSASITHTIDSTATNYKLYYFKVVVNTATGATFTGLSLTYTKANLTQAI